MTTPITALSNPFSTGGGGHNFENHVQTAFVVLMLTGGVIPCPKPWPIQQIKLQGRYAGFNTDDFIAFLEHRDTGRAARLLAQIKHSVSVTVSDAVFGDVIRAAWTDFKNPALFTQGRDAIALITGPMSATDVEHVRPLLEFARTSASSREFFEKVGLAKFSSDQKREKLEVFREHLKAVNNNTAVPDDELWLFLRSYHILGYDLDIKCGVTLSLLHSHISQFHAGDIAQLFSRISAEVAYHNQNAGTLTLANLPEEIVNVFCGRPAPAVFPQVLLTQPPTPPAPPQPAAAAPTQSPPRSDNRANALAIATLVGAFSEKSPADKEVVTKLLGT